MTGEDNLPRGRDSLAYIVRIWRSGPDGRWCFSVQAVATGERHGFAGLGDLAAYFESEMREAADSGDQPGEGR